MPRPADILAAIAALALLTATSCDSESSTAGARRTDTASPARHAVHSEGLHRIMHRLGTEVRRSWPQEIADEKAAEAARDRQAELEQAAGLARVLAESAKALPEAIADVELADEQKQAFLASAKRLGRQARRLEATAKAQETDQMTTVLDRIKTTCNACHGQFADLAGPISFGNSGG